MNLYPISVDGLLRGRVDRPDSRVLNIDILQDLYNTSELYTFRQLVLCFSTRPKR